MTFEINMKINEKWVGLVHFLQNNEIPLTDLYYNIFLKLKIIHLFLKDHDHF